MAQVGMNVLMERRKRVEVAPVHRPRHGNTSVHILLLTLLQINLRVAHSCKVGRKIQRKNSMKDPWEARGYVSITMKNRKRYFGEQIAL